MKCITAIVSVSKQDEVLDMVRRSPVSGLTVTEVQGFGRQHGKTEIYRGSEYTTLLVPKIKIEIFCKDEDCDAVVEDLIQICNTHKTGAGKIVVHDIDKAVRIRTGEINEDAV